MQPAERRGVCSSWRWQTTVCLPSGRSSRRGKSLCSQQNEGVSVPPGGGKQQYVSLLGGATEEVSLYAVQQNEGVSVPPLEVANNSMSPFWEGLQKR